MCTPENVDVTLTSQKWGMAQALLKQNAARARRHRWETTNLALYLSGSIMCPIWQLPLFIIIDAAACSYILHYYYYRQTHIASKSILHTVQLDTPNHNHWYEVRWNSSLLSRTGWRQNSNLGTTKKVCTYMAYTIATTLQLHYLLCFHQWHTKLPLSRGQFHNRVYRTAVFPCLESEVSPTWRLISEIHVPQRCNCMESTIIIIACCYHSNHWYTRN